MINATLFIQMINFALAYWIIEKLFFKPFVQIILKKEADEQALLDEKSTLLETQKAYGAQKDNLWLENVRQFVLRTPIIKTKPSSSLATSLEALKISLFGAQKDKDMHEAKIAQLTDIIIKKVQQ